MYLEETDEEVLDSSSDEEGSEQPEEATSQEAVEEEPEKVPYHKLPRWQERQRELEETREQVAYWKGIAEARKDHTPQEIEEKIVEANTPEEREFWQRVEKVSEAKAQKLVKSLQEEFKKERDIIYQQYGQVVAKQFLRDNPDIKMGSDELKDIVAYSRKTGVPLEDARKIVMYERDRETAAVMVKQKQQQKLKQKQAANLETKSVSRESLPDPEDQTLDEAFDSNWKKFMGE